MDSTSTIRLGALCWNQYTDWPDLLEAGVRADRLGYDTLWTWDHLYPIVGSHDGPIFEGWLTLAAWAQATEHVRIGLMVGANTFREPTADGEDGHDARPHLERPGDPRHRRRRGSRPSTRRSGSSSATASRSGCAGSARRCRSCAGCSTASGRRRPDRATRHGDVRNDPPPIQDRLPLLIGGGGEQVTLKLVATLRRREQRRRRAREREAQGGDPRSSTARRSGATRPRSSARPASAPSIIRDSRAEADAGSSDEIVRRTTAGASIWTDQPVGHARGRRRAARRRSSRSAIGTSSPASRRRYDEESMTRLADRGPAAPRARRLSLQPRAATRRCKKLARLAQMCVPCRP